LLAGSAADLAWALSGADSHTIWTLTPPWSPVKFGYSVGGGGDVDGDGVPDFAVGDEQSNYGVRDGGAVAVFSGASGSVLYQFASSIRNA
jgi:hypothetical protein